MKKLITLIIAFLLFPLSTLFSQEIDLKAHYNEITYNQYLKSDWQGIISTGKSAIESEIDFYYLRLRMGIAYAEMANFRLAIINYKKALEFVPNDPVAQEYLYYAYLYGGMKNMAKLYYDDLPINLRKKISRESLPAFGNIYFETGYALASYDNSEINFPGLSENYFSEIFTRKSQTYTNANLMFNLSNSASLSFAYTGLGVESVHQYKIRNEEAKTEDLKVKQSDLYASVNIYTKNNLILIPFFHNVNTSLAYTYVDYDTASYTLGSNINLNFNEQFSQFTENDQLAGIGFFKRSGLIDLSASVSYSALNQLKQQQINAKISILPKGNYSLYFTPEFRLFFEDNTQRSIYKITTGFTFSKNAWSELAFTYGNLQRTHENFGAIVYNLPDKTKYKADAVVHYAFKNGVSLSLRYQLTQKESVMKTNSLITNTTPGGGGFGQGSSTTVTDWQTTESLYTFAQHFIIFGFNWNL